MENTEQVLIKFRDRFFQNNVEKVQKSYSDYEDKIKIELDKRINARKGKDGYSFIRFDELLRNIKSEVSHVEFIKGISINDTVYDLDIYYLDKQIIFHSKDKVFNVQIGSITSRHTKI